MTDAKKFLQLALSQQGAAYVFGASARCSDPRPGAFDCSELVRWGLCRLGVPSPRTAREQFPDFVRRAGRLRVSEALRTPGAIMFKEGRGRHAPIYHVGISVGDGDRVMEAKSRRLGTGVFPVGNWAESPAQRMNVWNLAAKAPGLDYGRDWPWWFWPALGGLALILKRRI